MPSRPNRYLLPLATLAALGATALAYAAWVRPRMLRWGASANEALQPLPGDHLVPAPRTSFTRAITLRAVAAKRSIRDQDISGQCLPGLLA